MARRSRSGDLFVWFVAVGLVAVGGLLFLRDRGLLRWPQAQPKPADQRARDLVKKYPDAEVFSGPETDKKKD
ncbi:MAG: hypothetical protein EB090_04025 [Verrucomicrobia bacterium]|nr:hypothetical protein [Verrucomicrobiota bacterium]